MERSMGCNKHVYTQNIMKPLIAYDFDKTLLPYDSFRRYLWHLICRRPLRISCWLLLRKLRVISSKELKHRVTDMVESCDSLKTDAKRFANILKKDIHMWNEDNDTTILIITASPRIYMKYVAEDLKCDVLCSDYFNSVYIEMYGSTKAEYLHKMYPSTEYQYIYAKSDSESDRCWMEEFNKYEILETP